MHKFSIKLSFSSIGQDKSKLQKQISKLFILIEMAAWQFLFFKPNKIYNSIQIFAKTRIVVMFHFWFFKHISSTICVPLGAGRSLEVERSLMVWWVVGSILHGVDPLSYFSF